MQSKVPYKVTYIIPASPKTTRGQPSTLDISKNRLLYFNSCAVFIKQSQQKFPLVIYHTCDVTAAAFSNNGRHVASGDQKGHIIITQLLEDRTIQCKLFQNCIGGAVRTIDWTGDHNKIVIGGQGKNLFARVLNVDTGTNVGQIIGVSNTITTAGFRPQRPYKLVLAGEQKSVKFYQGPPYKFVKSQGQHSNVINHIRYDRKGDYYISVSTDKKIILYQGKTGSILKSKEKCHEAGIMSVDWFSNKTFITSSNDKSLKIWNLELQEQKVLKPKENTKLQDFQVAVRTNGDDIYSVSLNGNINYWKAPVSNVYPTHVYEGYTGKPLKLLHGNSTFYTFDSSGKVFYYHKTQKALKSFSSDKQSKTILDGDISGCGTLLYILLADQNIRIFNCENNSLQNQVNTNGTYNYVSVNRHNKNKFALAGDNVSIFKQTQKTNNIKIDYQISALSWANQHLAVGNLKGQVYLYTGQLTLTHVISHGSYRITVLSFNDELLYVGDSSRIIRLWNYKDNTLFSSAIGNHNALVTDISIGNETILTSGIDNKVGIWNKKTLKNELEIADHHKRGVLAVTYLDDQLVTVGGDFIIKFTKLNTRNSY